jgi:PPM family protein phosphatase
LRFGVKSDKGMIREINEDSYNIIAGYSGVPVSFIIADGMGGHNSGEIASKMAVDLVSEKILQIPEIPDFENRVSETIKCFIEEANKEVYEASKKNADNYGMGTTLIVALIHEKKLYIGHVGDSRVYLLRGNLLIRLTTDHSYIEELIKIGTLTREEAENHPKRNVITRALGCSEEIEVDLYISDIKESDLFILCTDGLTNMLEEEEISNIILENEDPETACSRLVNSANSAGGEDNITVIVIRN